MSLISGNESKIFAKGVIGNVRKAQEDSHGYKLGTPNGDLFVVCDGMGGHVGGATASRIAVDSIISHIDKEQYATPIDALNGALQFANMQILGHADAHPELKGMGTTACIVLVQGDGVWIAHVGDSRIYLYMGKEKQLHRITKDHSYVQTLVDAGEITDEEAEHHPNKNRIMKALGIKPELQPSFNFENRPIHPKNGDIFLICSDGLSGMIPDRTIHRVMDDDSLTLHQKGERLIELAMEGETVRPGGQDNCTLEMIGVDNSNWATSEFKSYNPVETRPVETPAAHEPEPRIQEAANSQSIPSFSNIKEEKKRPSHTNPMFIAIAVVALIVLGIIIWHPWSTRVSEKAIQKAVDDTIESYNDYKSLEESIRQYNDSINALESKIKSIGGTGKSADNMRKTQNKLREEIEQIDGEGGTLKDAYLTHEKRVANLKALQSKNNNK